MTSKATPSAMPALAPATIAGLAKQTGIDVAAIRSFHQMGLLPKPQRRTGRRGDAGYRAAHLARLTFIQRAIELGFSLEAIRELLGLSGGLRTCGDIYAVAERQLADIRRRIADLGRMETALAQLAAACPRTGAVHDCPVIHSLSRPS